MKLSVAILSMALLLTPVLAAAQQKGGVELTSTAEVEVVEKSEIGETVTKLIAADKANVLPGDTVIFTIIYVNTGGQPATGVVINNPVPEHMEYVDKSAEGAGTGITFSVDKGKVFGLQAALKIIGKDGKERPARAADITNVRWSLDKPLAAGDKGSVSYRAKVK